MRTFYSVLFAFLFAATCLAQDQASTNSPESTQMANRFAPGAQLRVELDKSIDAKKAKSGDPVVAKMMDEIMAGDKVVAPRGAKVMGHLVEATSHQGDTPSTLGIAFDKMILPDGKEIPLDATIQAISRPEINTNFGQPGSMGGNGNSGGMNSGNTMGRPLPGMGAPPATGNPNGGNPNSPPTDAAPQTVNGQLTPTSQGVVNMSGVSLGTGTKGNSLLTSEKHNVKLDSGTEMVLHTR